MKRVQQHDVEIIYQCHLSDGGVMFPHTVHTVSPIFFTSTCSSYAVYYYRPIPLTRHPFISPHLFLPSLPHFTCRLSEIAFPYPILNRAQPSFSYLHLFLCFTSIPHYVAKLPCWAEQIGKKERKTHCSCCGHWLMKGGCDSAKKPLKIGEDREDEIPI